MALDMTERLRAMQSLTGTIQKIDIDALPADPAALFAEWLDAAEAAAVPEPHAMTVATVDADGLPDARMLVLKGLDGQGWSFAGTASGRRGGQLAARPLAALNFWWQPLVRAVRVRGVVIEATLEESEADLAARSEDARRDVAPGDWRLWRVQAERVEFWQGSTDRRHTRIVYERTTSDWNLTVMRGEETLRSE